MKSPLAFLFAILLFLPHSLSLASPPKKRRRLNLPQATSLPVGQSVASQQKTCEETVDWNKEVATKKPYIETQMILESLGHTREEALEHIKRYLNNKKNFSPKAQLLVELLDQKLPEIFNNTTLPQELSVLKDAVFHTKGRSYPRACLLKISDPDILEAFIYYKTKDRYYNRLLKEDIFHPSITEELITATEMMEASEDVVAVLFKHKDPRRNTFSFIARALQGFSGGHGVNHDRVIRHLISWAQGPCESCNKKLGECSCLSHLQPDAGKSHAYYNDETVSQCIHNILGHSVLHSSLHSVLYGEERAIEKLATLLKIPGINVNTPVTEGGCGNGISFYYAPSLLTCAEEKGYPNVAKLLREYGATKINYADETAVPRIKRELEKRVGFNNVEGAAALLKVLRIRDDAPFYSNLLENAERNGLIEMARLLRQCGVRTPNNERTVAALHRNNAL